MNIRFVLAGTLALALLSACTPTEQQKAADTMMNDEHMMDDSSAMMKDDDAMMDDKMMDDGMKKEDSMMKDDEMMDDSAMMHKATYTDYSASVLANGETKVLFFHAAWCPVCRSADAELKDWYAAGLPTRNVYKVDYDTSADLKAKFGVTYQHTFVLVDGEGNALQTVTGPTDAVLKAMIGA